MHTSAYKCNYKKLNLSLRNQGRHFLDLRLGLEPQEQGRPSTIITFDPLPSVFQNEILRHWYGSERATTEPLQTCWAIADSQRQHDTEMTGDSDR